ncbi:putative cytokinin oxidase [Labilithrix luteola]|uniref:Putative cytokinin oxidase n=1 Tax=Labilithrix luteola TaxID=1391654 RepID=A0A0K1PJC8_9BACT|nr:FAD-binding protein [Labilithrix luteola]AKU93648.1 putative cytokinin oxidase [Labilithrix luteola]
MLQAFARRKFLSGLAAGAVVLGFDPVRRSWVTEAHANGPLDGIPSLDGMLVTDNTSIQEAADDYGHIVHRSPRAVLRPGSIQDIVKIVKFARRHRLQVAMRGQGHSNYGQAQAFQGVVIDSRTLDTVHQIGGNRATVDAGVTWRTVIEQGAAVGITPPVLTDYQDLSVGGTLSVGGLGGATQHHGLQVDNVLELTVVTGEGDLVTCSPTRNSDLFEVVLAGLGQFAIIVRATIRMIPAPTQARVYNLYYDDIALYTKDQRRLLAEGRFGYLEGQVVPSASDTGWRFMIEAAAYYTPPSAPNDAALLAGLKDNPSERVISETTYTGWQFRIDPTVEFLKALGVWFFPHPWYSVFVPASKANEYVGNVLSTLTEADTGQGPILFYPIATSKIGASLYPLPNEPVAFAFNLLRTAPPDDPATVAAMVADNRRLYEKLVCAGGTRYSIGSIPFSRHDWQQHFGRRWGLLTRSKRHYDPDNVLTPGQGIFT